MDEGTRVDCQLGALDTTGKVVAAIDGVDNRFAVRGSLSSVDDAGGSLSDIRCQAAKVESLDWVDSGRLVVDNRGAYVTALATAEHCAAAAHSFEAAHGEPSGVEHVTHSVAFAEDDVARVVAVGDTVTVGILSHTFIKMLAGTVDAQTHIVDATTAGTEYHSVESTVFGIDQHIGLAAVTADAATIDVAGQRELAVQHHRGTVDIGTAVKVKIFLKMAVAILACNGCRGTVHSRRICTGINFVAISLGIINTIGVNLLQVERIVAVAAAIDVAADGKVAAGFTVDDDVRDAHRTGEVVAAEHIAANLALGNLDVSVVLHIGDVAAAIDVLGHDNIRARGGDVGADGQRADNGEAGHSAHIAAAVDVAHLTLQHNDTRNLVHLHVVVAAEDGADIDVVLIVGRSGSAVEEDIAKTFFRGAVVKGIAGSTAVAATEDAVDIACLTDVDVDKRTALVGACRSRAVDDDALGRGAGSDGSRLVTISIYVFIVTIATTEDGAVDFGSIFDEGVGGCILFVKSQGLVLCNVDRKAGIFAAQCRGLCQRRAVVDLGQSKSAQRAVDATGLVVAAIDVAVDDGAAADNDVGSAIDTTHITAAIDVAPDGVATFGVTDGTAIDVKQRDAAHIKHCG